MQNRISQHLWKAAWEHYVISFHISSFSQALIFLIDTALGGKKNIKDKHVVNVMIRYWKSSAGAAMWWSDVVQLNTAPRTSSKATKTLSVFKNNLNFYSARLKNKPTPSKKGKIMRLKFSKKVKLHWRKVTHRWLNISRDLFLRNNITWCADEYYSQRSTALTHKYPHDSGRFGAKRPRRSHTSSDAHWAGYIRLRVNGLLRL